VLLWKGLVWQCRRWSDIATNIVQNEEQAVGRVNDAHDERAKWRCRRKVWNGAGRWWTSVEHRLVLNRIAGHHLDAFVVINPQERANLFVQFGQCWEVEVAIIAFCKIVARDLKRSWWCESLDTSFFVRGFPDPIV